MKKTLLVLAFLALSMDIGPPISGAEQASTAGMVMIPSGGFIAGVVPEVGLAECRKHYNDCHNDSFEKLHWESVRSFSMDKYEVTQAEYEKVMGNNPSSFKGSNLPVDSVTWDEAKDYCQKTGKRLPTEWEWEFAARGRSNSLYAWGENGDDAGRYAWYAKNAHGTTHPVGQKKPNSYGLYDMAGNVLEWTASDFDSKHKVLRGGSWADNLFIMRSAGRYYYGPSTHDLLDYGFRCAQ